MRSIFRFTLCVLLGLFAVTTSVRAQSADAAASAKAKAEGQAGAQAGPASSQANAQAEAAADAQVHADASKQRAEVESRAAHASSQAKAKAEAKLAATANKVDESAQKDGSATVAARLAAEFGTTADALVREQHDMGASWGQVMIAHAIAANLKSGVSSEQLLTWHADHMGWGEMAAGLGLDLGSVVGVANAEGRVAEGLAHADGKVAAMRGEGARGFGANLDAGSHAQLGNGAVGVGANAGLGVKIGH